jgi:hypothetical protein
MYYAWSPPLADLIARHPLLRALTRWALTPVVWAVERPRAGLVALLGWSALLLGLVRRRRLRRSALA